MNMAVFDPLKQNVCNVLCLIKVFTNDFIQKYTYLENLKWKKLRKILQKCFDSNVLPFSFFCSISLFFIEKLHNEQNNKLNSVPKCYTIFNSSIYKMWRHYIFFTLTFIVRFCAAHDFFSFFQVRFMLKPVPWIWFRRQRFECLKKYFSICGKWTYFFWKSYNEEFGRKIPLQFYDDVWHKSTLVRVQKCSSSAVQNHLNK